MAKRMYAASLCLLIVSVVAGHDAAARNIGTTMSSQIAYSPKTQTTAALSSASAKSTIKELNKAIDQEPNNSTYFYRRANLYQQIGDKKHALSDFSDAIRLSPMNAQYYLGRAHLYRERGDEVLAEADEKQAKFVDGKPVNQPQPARGRRRMPGRHAGLNRVIRAVE
jgi:Tfp pilus assembly protein PilF